MCHGGVHLYVSSCVLGSYVSGVVMFHGVGSWCSVIDLCVMVTQGQANLSKIGLNIIGWVFLDI